MCSKNCQPLRDRWLRLSSQSEVSIECRSSFFDTSAFAKRHHDEAGSGRVSAIFRTPGSVFHLSSLDPRNAVGVAMKVRTAARANALRTAMLADIADQALSVVTVDESHFFNSTGRGAGPPSQRPLHVLVVADRLLAENAIFEGLSILNPEDVQ